MGGKGIVAVSVCGPGIGMVPFNSFPPTDVAQFPELIQQFIFVSQDYPCVLSSDVMGKQVYIK